MWNPAEEREERRSERGDVAAEDQAADVDRQMKREERE
jgi:hypothetical protein